MTILSGRKPNQTLRIITLLFFVINFGVSGQSTKKITIEDNSSHYSKEIYYVLRSNKKIKHGEYRSYGWTRKLSEKGAYSNGEKSGIWEFYQATGELEQRYDYNERKLLYSKNSDPPFTTWTYVDGEYNQKQPETLPLFIGGMRRLFKNLDSFVYPSEAKLMNVDCRVVVSAIITESGKMTDEQISTGSGHGCDEEILKAIKLIPDEWIPATLKGQNVKTKIFIPITFKRD